jgi:hypothetical protein
MATNTTKPTIVGIDNRWPQTVKFKDAGDQANFDAWWFAFQISLNRQMNILKAAIEKLQPPTT